MTKAGNIIVIIYN